MKVQKVRFLLVFPSDPSILPVSTNFIRKCCFLAVLHVLQYKKCLVPCDKCVVCTFGARERVQHMQLTLGTLRFVLEVRS